MFLCKRQRCSHRIFKKVIKIYLQRYPIIKGTEDHTGKRSLIFRRGFYIFIGLTLVLVGIFASFASPGAINMSEHRFTQHEYGAISFACGAIILIACHLTKKSRN